MGLIWDKRHQMYVEESPAEARARANRIRASILALEEKLEAERINKERRGYCPKCNMYSLRVESASADIFVKHHTRQTM